MFPWLEHAAGAAAIAGAVLGYLLCQAFHCGVSGLVFGAIVGALAGACLALDWAAGRAASPSDVDIDLWDPWVDEGEPTPEALDEPDGGSGEPVIRVRPRVESPESGESAPLEDRIGPILAGHERGAIRISGPDGSGKSTALAYLARVVPPHMQVAFLDGPDPLAVAEVSARGLVVFASEPPCPRLLAEMKLTPWGRDEWIEYLLAGDRDLCAPVMERLARHEGEIEFLEGIPELWTIVLDHMAADASVDGPRQALRIELDRVLVDRDFRALIEYDCLDALVLRWKQQPGHTACLLNHEPGESLLRLIRHRAIQLLLAADRIADELTRGAECRALAGPLPPVLVGEAARRVAGHPGATERLNRLLADPDERMHPMAASLLHATRTGWKPGRPSPCLKGAYLDRARWFAIALDGADLQHADLSQSDLWGARLDRARLGHARLSSADLRSASLCGCHLSHADLGRARLAGARAEEAQFDSARLNAADLSGAVLDRVILRAADLRDALLAGTRLVGADLSRSRIDGANFSRAFLSGAVLSGLKLAVARFDGARFAGANLSHCDLEGMALPRADFAGANLRYALLTGSSMPGANFRGADLLAAGLAEVEWERADLREADLREAAFHLGSSRSGLVGSPIACEGSRTGFYTDDFNEQDFKSPEEIRKANLLGADLRGANIDGVDFYLVDLRGARVDPERIPHLRRCGAILESRA